MPSDLKQAGATIIAFEKLFAAHPIGRLDRAAFESVQDLCREAERVIFDIACRRELRNIEIYSALLSSDQSEAPRAADFVRMRVEHALASLGRRLKVLQASDAVAA